MRYVREIFMQNFYNIDKLNFLTAGMPLSTGKGGYNAALDLLNELDLDGMELEFVHGVRMNEETKRGQHNEKDSCNRYGIGYGFFFPACPKVWKNT